MSSAEGPSKLLIVEDDDDLRDTLTELLGSMDFQVLVAKDGLEAVQIAISDPPELILLDYRMPGLDGEGVVTRLRMAEIHTIIVLMTAARDARRLARELELPYYLEKPFQLEDLEALLSRALRRGG